MVKYEIKEASVEIRIKSAKKYEEMLKEYTEGCSFNRDDVDDSIISTFDNPKDAKAEFSKYKTSVKYMESFHNMPYYLITEYQLVKVLFDENNDIQEYDVLETTKLPLIWKDGSNVEPEELSSIHALYEEIGADHEWEDLQEHIFREILMLNTGSNGNDYIRHYFNSKHDYCNAICEVGTKNIIENDDALFEELFSNI